MPQKQDDAPMLQVLFTNFSHVSTKPKMRMRRSLSNFGSNQKERVITFEELCNDYRHKLVEQLALDQDSKNKYGLS